MIASKWFRFLVMAIIPSALLVQSAQAQTPGSPPGTPNPDAQASDPAAASILDLLVPQQQVLDEARKVPQLTANLIASNVPFGSLVVTTAPVITSISGVSQSASGVTNGRIDETIGKNWNTYLVINDTAGVMKLTINGSGFGPSSAQGAVTINGQSIPIKSWSDTAIVIDPIASAVWGSAHQWEWSPFSGDLVVTTGGASKKSYKRPEKFAPALVTVRVYGQCTHKVAAERYRLNKTPSPSAYAGYSTIDAKWVPANGDQVFFTQSTDKHAAIIEGVSKTTANGTVTYSLTIVQRNAGGKNEDTTYSATFAVKNNAVVTLPKCSITGWNAAASYYR